MIGLLASASQTISTDFSGSSFNIVVANRSANGCCSTAGVSRLSANAGAMMATVSAAASAADPRCGLSPNCVRKEVEPTRSRRSVAPKAINATPTNNEAKRGPSATI